jgi:hypothetical protein
MIDGGMAKEAKPPKIGDLDDNPTMAPIILTGEEEMEDPPKMMRRRRGGG